MRRSSLPPRSAGIRRSPLGQTRTPIPQRSAKRVAENEERRDVRMVVEARSGGWCEACPVLRPGGGRSPALDLHEVLTRARGGSIVDPANILHCCRPCHSFVTEHPVEAQALGLVRWSWEGPLPAP